MEAPQASGNGLNGTIADDVDMRRATDLLELHYGVKMKLVRGEGKVLLHARIDVEAALDKLRKRGTGNVMRKST